MRNILILEDEEDIREFIAINLRRAGFRVFETDNGDEAVKIALGNNNIDIAVLDVMVNGIDGFDVCKLIRQTNKIIGIIMLTAKSQEMDKVTGLYSGADDYVVKPFSPTELVARIDALCRRVDQLKSNADKFIKVGPFELDTKGHKLMKNSCEIELTQIEYSIVKLFMENQDKAYSRDEILDCIWGENYFGNWKTVDVNIRRIRQKIEEDPSNPVFIKTIWGYGYKWGKDDQV